MSDDLDLILVHPGNRIQIYQSLGESLSALEPPVWAGLMATYVRKRGFRVEIVDVEAENWPPDRAAAHIAERKPRLCAIVVYGHQPSASTQNMTASSAIASAVRQAWPEAKILLVGGHVAALPERTLREETDVDFVAAGEGPATLAELCAALQAGETDLSKVRGLWFRDAGSTAILRSSPPAPMVADLDAEMGAIAWDLLPMDKYRAHNWHCFGKLQRAPYASIYTTLGCPYKCSFCCIQAPFRAGEKLAGLKESVNSYRFWSPREVVDQIDHLVMHYGVRNIKIADEMFVLNARHVGTICDLLIERGHDLNIWAYARVDTVRDGLIDKMRRAGITWLAFGVEAASERVRDDVDKGFGQDLVFSTLRAVRAAGIHVIGNFIFGLPEDDLASMQATLDLALELGCEFVNFYCAMAYPGSQLYQLALRENWALPEKWSGYSQHSVDSLPLPTKHLPAAEVLRFRDRAFQTYFSNPRYLEMIAQKFGEPTARHIREMAAHKLERRYA